MGSHQQREVSSPGKLLHHSLRVRRVRKECFLFYFLLQSRPKKRLPPITSQSTSDVHTTVCNIRLSHTNAHCIDLLMDWPPLPLFSTTDHFPLAQLENSRQAVFPHGLIKMLENRSVIFPIHYGPAWAFSLTRNSCGLHGFASHLSKFARSTLDTFEHLCFHLKYFHTNKIYKHFMAQCLSRIVYSLESGQKTHTIFY